MPVRGAQISFDHLIAEFTAYPLGEAAFALAPVDLDPTLAGETRALWRSAENHLVSRFPGISVDEALLFRDAIWFPNRPKHAMQLSEWLVATAENFLAKQGDRAVPRLPTFGEVRGAPGEAAARRCWRWLSFALPPDLLIAALSTSAGGCREIHLLSPPIDYMLKTRRFAETHLHIGAGLDFATLWIAALHSIALEGDEDVAPHRIFESPGASLHEGRDLATAVLCAGIARFILASFLRESRETRNSRFDNFAEELLDDFARTCGEAATARLSSGIRSLAAGRMDISDNERLESFMFTRMSAAYRQLTRIQLDGCRTTLGNGAHPSDEIRGEPMVSDPIAGLLALNDNEEPEISFVRQSLEYMRGLGTTDTGFAKLFWQVVRVRVMFYRHMTQRPMIPGLQWFIRFYARISPARRVMTLGMLTASAARVCGSELGLLALEARTSPADTTDENVDMVREFHLSMERVRQQLQSESEAKHGRVRDRADLEAGLIFHFTKDRGGKSRSGHFGAAWCSGHAMPGLGNPYRFSLYYAKKRREATAVADLLWQKPDALNVLRAVDVCTDEMGTPNWVLAPLITYLRRLSDDLAERSYEFWAIRPLAVTAHAGEDFVHLMTGLRCISEVVSYFGMRHGDRIGHAVALGVDVESWVRQKGRIPVFVETRLFDVIWEFVWHASRGGCARGDRTNFLEREIARLSDYMFSRAWTPWEGEQFLKFLHDPVRLASTGFPGLFGKRKRALEGEGEVTDNVRTDLCRYLTDPAVFHAGTDTEWVDAERDGEALVDMQTRLRREIGCMGITVEINPSSNLLIADLADLERHPLWRLRPPRPSTNELPPISICIGSDDPITFASTLPNEYQFAADALHLAGLSDEEVSAWIDRVRETGLERRFTLPRGTWSWPEEGFWDRRRNELLTRVPVP